MNEEGGEGTPGGRKEVARKGGRREGGGREGARKEGLGGKERKYYE